MCSSAKQPNKHIITLSRRPPTLKTRLPYKREHLFTATQDVDISPAGRPSFRWHRPLFRGAWPWEGRGGPRMAAGTARQAHTAPTNHQKRYQIPRRRPLQVHSCHIRHCGKMRSSAQQPNKHIIALSRRPPVWKLAPVQAGAHFPGHSQHQHTPPTPPKHLPSSGRISRSCRLGRPSDGSRESPAGLHSTHKSPKKLPDSTTQATASAQLLHTALR